VLRYASAAARQQAPFAGSQAAIFAGGAVLTKDYGGE